MKAKIRFHQKLTLVHENTFEVALAELKVLEVPKSSHYPDGIKYSLFLVLKESGDVLIGFDNHKPKGPHLHFHGEEEPYSFEGEEKLVEDFWDLVRKEGFSP
mgnify:CR=1 FL=1